MAAEGHVDVTIGNATLLIACMGGTAAADRLGERWRAVTERPASALVADSLVARGFAMLFAARGAVPGWADGMVALDLDAELAAHRAHLSRGETPIPAGLFGDSPAGRVVAGIAEEVVDGSDRAPDRLKQLAAQADAAAAAGDIARVNTVLAEWVAMAGIRPRVALLAGCERLAALLTEGVLAGPLGIDDGWPDVCAGELIAALHVLISPGVRGNRNLVVAAVDRAGAGRPRGRGCGTAPGERTGVGPGHRGRRAAAGGRPGG